MTKVKLAALSAALVLGGIAAVPIARAVSASRNAILAVPMSQAKQDAFLLGLTQYDCNQRTRKYIEGVQAFDALADPDEVAATLSLMGLQAQKERVRQAKAYAQVSEILFRMNAPVDLQKWADQTKTQLAAPVVVSPEVAALAKADSAKPRFASVQNEQQLVAVYAVSDEMSEMQNASNAHQASLTSWLGRRGDDTAWARNLGALAAELNWKEVVIERQNPSAGPQTIAYSLLQTAPTSTPSNIQSDLDRLNALRLGSTLTGAELAHRFEGARADFCKTYNVKPTQIWPI